MTDDHPGASMFRHGQDVGKVRILDDRDGGCRIVIHGIRPRNWFDVAMGILIGWGLIELTCILMICDILTGRRIPGQFSLSTNIAILAVWTPLGFWLWWRFFRFFSGLREVLSIRGDLLVIREVDFYKDRITRYPLAEIRDLRYEIWEMRRPTRPGGRMESGIICFDSRGYWNSFGMGLSEAQCRGLIEFLESRFGVPLARSVPISFRDNPEALLPASKE